MKEYFSTKMNPSATTQARGTCIKILITSRSDTSIKETFQELQKIRLKGENETGHISHDVELVVKANLKDLARSGLSESLLSDLQQQLIDGADRTFLWVTLIIKLLKDASRKGVTEEELEAIIRSRDIDTVYSRLLKNRPDPAMTRKMLVIVIGAGRPLTTTELSISMAVSKDRERIVASSTIGMKQDDSNDLENVSINRVTSNQEAEPSVSHRIERHKDIPVAELYEDSALKAQAAHRITGIHNPVAIQNDASKLLEMAIGLSDQKGALVSTPDVLGRIIKRPIDNYIHSVCGHFLRIIQDRIYLVHQTAEEFLAKPPPSQQVTSRRQESTTLPIRSENPLLKPWQNTILPSGAEYFLLVICTEYLRMFDSPSEIERSFQDNYSDFCQRDSVRGFLNYASLYWPRHFRQGRRFVDDKKKYQHLCTSEFKAFHIWTAENSSFTLNFGPGRINVPKKQNNYSFEQEVMEFFHL